MKTIEMKQQQVRKGFGVADGMRGWLESEEGKKYAHLAVVQLLAAILGVSDEAYKAKDQSIAERIAKGVQYVARVTGQRIVADVIALDEQVMAAVNNAVNALASPKRITDATQRVIWSPEKPLANIDDLTAFLNAFGKATFKDGDFEQCGAAILANAVGVGTAEGKTHRHAYTLTATGSLTAANLREIGETLPNEGTAIEALGDDTCVARRDAGQRAFGYMTPAQARATQRGATA